MIAVAQDIAINGSFEDGLNGWQIRGAVAGSSGIAVVTDEDATKSLLSQPVSATPGVFTLRFDFRNALSGAVPTGRLPDTFFATLYFTDDAGALDIEGGAYDRAIPLFDLDANGSFNVNGAISASSKGAGWSGFTFNFNNAHRFIVPAFELRDLNFLNDDSAVAVDNVILLPEVGPIGLIAASGAGIIGLSRKRRTAG